MELFQVFYCFHFEESKKYQTRCMELFHVKNLKSIKQDVWNYSKYSTVSFHFEESKEYQTRCSYSIMYCIFSTFKESKEYQKDDGNKEYQKDV
jgi:hypothetical protein